ncbi:hypothetical protein V8F20_012006 [Naviculisporaceae sp. PSN 640]
MEQQRNEAKVTPSGEAAAIGNKDKHVDIRTGIPLEPPRGFKRAVEAMRREGGRAVQAVRRQGPRRKKTVKKGKQPEVVANCNGLEGQNGSSTRPLPPSQSTKQKEVVPKPTIRPSQVPNGSLTEPAKGGPSQAKQTNTVYGEPVMPSEGHSVTSTATERPQETSTAQPSTIPVKIPRSKFDRIRHMEFKTSIQLKAREVRLSKPETDKLGAFSEFVSTRNQQILFGKRPLPQCHAYVVELHHECPEPQTYICISGLKEEDDIRRFYAVMSQREHRKYYEPWKLCFRMAEVPNCAAPCALTAAGQDNNPTSPVCRIFVDDLAITLCGAPARIRTERGERMATIGGLIQAGGEIFALTTGHAASTQERSLDESTMWASSASTSATLQDLDLPDDVESILIIDDPEIVSEGKRSVTWEPECFGPVGVDSNTIHEEDDWCLIAIPEEYHFPNLCNIPELHMLTGMYSGEDPGDQHVYATGARSGIVGGYVAPAPSFLIRSNGSIQVRAVNLEGGQSIGVGDSGSWFVTRSTAQVLGPLVARCDGTGKALITMLSDQFESISRSFPFDDFPSLAPSRVLLLRAANHWYSNDQVGRAEHLVDVWLHTIAALPSSQHSVFTRTFERGIRELDAEQNRAMISLIMKVGPDIESFLALASLDWEENSLNLQEVTVLLLLRRVYRELAEVQTHDNGHGMTATKQDITSLSSRRLAIAPSTFSTLLSSTLVGDSERRSTIAPKYPIYSLAPDAPRAHLIEEGPDDTRYTIDDVLEETASPRRRQIWRPPRRNLLWALSVIFGLCYLAGLGVGAWKLITVDGVLDLGGKIGTGVAIILVNLFLIIVVYMLKTSR